MSNVQCVVAYLLEGFVLLCVVVFLLSWQLSLIMLTSVFLLLKLFRTSYRMNHNSDSKMRIFLKDVG